MPQHNTFTDEELSLIAAISNGKVMFKEGQLSLLIPRFAWTYSASNQIENSDLTLSNTTLQTLFSSESVIEVVDTKKDFIDKQDALDALDYLDALDALDYLIMGNDIPMLYTDILEDISISYDPKSIKSEALEAYLARFRQLESMFSSNSIKGLPDEIEELEKENKDYLIEKLGLDSEEILKKALLEYDFSEKNESTDLVNRAIVYLETQARERIINAEDPRTQSTYNLMTLMELRNYLEIDKGDLDMLVIGMDLKNVRKNNNEVSSTEVDNLLSAITLALSQSSRKDDYGLRKHGSGGDELLMIMYFGRDENNKRHKQGIDRYDLQKLSEIAQKKAQDFIFRAVRNQLNYIQKQINSGRYKLKS